MRKLILALLLLSAPKLFAQGQGYTNVIGSGKTCYANGSVQASFLNQSGSPQLPLLNGSVFPTTGVTNFNSAGAFSFYLADNLQVFPTPSQWSITACGKTGGAPACGTTQVTITGPVTDLSSAIANFPCGGSPTPPCSSMNSTQYFGAGGFSCDPNVIVDSNTHQYFAPGVNNQFAAQQFNSGGSGAIQAAINAACNLSPHGTVVVSPTVTDTAGFSPVCPGDTNVAYPIQVNFSTSQGDKWQYTSQRFGLSTAAADNGPAMRNLIQACQANLVSTGVVAMLVIQPGTYKVASSITWNYSGSKTSTITNIAIASGVVTVTANNTFTAGQLIIIRGTNESFLNEHTFYIESANSTSYTFMVSHADMASAPDQGVGTNQFTAGFVIQSCPITVAGHAPHKVIFDYVGTDLPDTLALQAGPEVGGNSSSGGIRGVQFGNTQGTTYRGLMFSWLVDNNYKLEDIDFNPAILYDEDFAGGFTNAHFGLHRFDGVGTGGYFIRIACVPGSFLRSFDMPQFTWATATTNATQPASIGLIDANPTQCNTMGTLSFGANRTEWNVTGSGVQPGGGVIEITGYSLSSKGAYIHLHDMSLQNQVWAAGTHDNYIVNFTQQVGDGSGFQFILENFAWSGMSGFNNGGTWNGTGTLVNWPGSTGAFAYGIFGFGPDYRFRTGIFMQASNLASIMLGIRGPVDTFDRFQVNGAGQMFMGPGNGALDFGPVYRCAASTGCIGTGGTQFLRLAHIQGSSGAPTVAVGAGAGSGALATISGSDTSGTVNITPGTGAAAGVVATVTWSIPYTAAPVCVVNQNGGTTFLGVSNTATTTTLTISTAVAMTGSTRFNYSGCS